MTIENLDIKNIDEAIFEFMIQNKKNDSYPVNCEFQKVFNDYQLYSYLTSKLYANKTMCFWQKILVNAIKDFTNEGYNFNHIAKMNIKTIANIFDMTYDF